MDVLSIELSFPCWIETLKSIRQGEWNRNRNIRTIDVHKSVSKGFAIFFLIIFKFVWIVQTSAWYNNINQI